MLRQQAQDVDAAEEVELRRLEGHPEACRAVAVLAAARVVVDGEHAPIGLRLAQAWPRWLVCAMRMQGPRALCTLSVFVWLGSVTVGVETWSRPTGTAL